jgi:tRNA dimethylallyltransferase
MAAGFLAEVERLRAGPLLSHTAAQALGYRELLAHLRGEVTLDDALATAITRTRQFARRQRVWFRRDPRITWVGAADDPMVAFGALEAEAAALWD